MPFRLREDAEDWFKALDGKEPAKAKFDLYYFCLIAGLASGRTKDSSSLDAREIIDEFIQDYQAAQHLIIGLLVSSEVRRHGINLNEKQAVREVFRRLVTPDSRTQLTEEGLRCMNAYASGGYEYLAESRESRPETPEEFIRDFIGLIANAIENGYES